jgi:hypothetical protein
VLDVRCAAAPVVSKGDLLRRPSLCGHHFEPVPASQPLAQSTKSRASKNLGRAIERTVRQQPMCHRASAVVSFSRIANPSACTRICARSDPSRTIRGPACANKCRESRVPTREHSKVRAPRCAPSPTVCARSELVRHCRSDAAIGGSRGSRGVRRRDSHGVRRRDSHGVRRRDSRGVRRRDSRGVRLDSRQVRLDSRGVRRDSS